MAEAISKDITKAMWDNVVISSAWTNADWSPISHNAMIALQEIQLDARSHLSRPIDQTILDSNDVILTMTEQHKQFLTENFKNLEHKVQTLKESIWETWDVWDPYGESIEKYRATREEIRRILLWLFK